MSAAIKNVKMLVRYRAWANELIYEAVIKLMSISEVSEHQHKIFQKILRLLNHTRIVDLIWKAHITGCEHGFTERNPTEFPALSELQREQKEIDAWYVSWGDTIKDEDLSDNIDFTLIGGKQGRMTRYDMLFHVVNHASYHRGMIATLFFELSTKLPATDFTVFDFYNAED